MGLYAEDGLYTYPPRSSGEEPKRLRKGTYSKIVLGLVIGTVLVYTAAVLVVSWAGGVVPDSLTYSFYGFFGTEVVSLVTIKCKKLKGERADAAFGKSEGNIGENSGGEVLRGAEEDGAEADTAVQE